MGRFSAILRWGFDLVVAAGAVACVLVWLEVKPNDLRMALVWPHWTWLVSAIILFIISLCSSSYSLYHVLTFRNQANFAAKPLVDVNPKESDPRIRVEIIEKSGGRDIVPVFTTPPQTFFLLHNEGGGTAYRVKAGIFDVSSTNFGKAYVSFKEQESIAVGKEVEVILKSESESFNGSDPGIFLDRICADSKPTPDEVIRHATILFEDYRGNGFETGIEIVYRPNKNPLGQVRQYTARNHEFKTVERA